MEARTALGGDVEVASATGAENPTPRSGGTPERGLIITTLLATLTISLASALSLWAMVQQ